MIKLTSVAVLSGAIILSSCIPSAEQEFWGRLTSLCGNTYDGYLTSEDPQDADFNEAKLWMEVSDCQANQVTVDFMRDEEAVGHWVLTRHKGQIELRHVHEGDPLTGYGGFSSDDSSGTRMNFPADEATKTLFDAENIPASKENIWAIRIMWPVFVYTMERPNRFFQVEFDTTTPISTD